MPYNLPLPSNTQLITTHDVFVTGDKNLRYQQNLAGRRLAIVELPANRWPLLRPLEARIVAAVGGCLPSSYSIVSAA